MYQVILTKNVVNLLLNWHTAKWFSELTSLKIELNSAITLLRQAKIAADALRGEDLARFGMAYARQKAAQRAYNRIKRAYAPYAKEVRAATRFCRIRDRRYASQHNRLSRTTVEARAMRAERKARAQSARLQAQSKRDTHAQSHYI